MLSAVTVLFRRVRMKGGLYRAKGVPSNRSICVSYRDDHMHVIASLRDETTCRDCHRLHDIDGASRFEHFVVTPFCACMEMRF